MTKSIDAEQNLRLSQVGKVTTENYVSEEKVEAQPQTQLVQQDYSQYQTQKEIIQKIG